jgi:uncharacterized protein (DUF488 family)
MLPVIYTIGHSNHEIASFIELLEGHGVNCVVDVRSVPVSQRYPQFSKEALKAALAEHDILYLHFGKEFGARRENAAVQNDTGQVDFEKVRRTDAFQQGIKRLETGLEQGYAIALMCAESHPLDCHRFSMVSVHLDEMGWEIRHIMKDKTIVPHREMEQEMMKRFAKKLPQPSLFEPDITEDFQRMVAYRLHNQAVGWKAEED